MVALCPPKRIVSLRNTGTGYRAELDAYVTEEAVKFVPDLPYDVQAGIFRLITTEAIQANVGDVIDGVWIVQSAKNHWDCRSIAECLRFLWRGVATVDVYTLLSLPSPTGGTQKTLVQSGLTVGHVEITSTATLDADIQVPAGTHVFGVPVAVASGLEPENTLIRFAGRNYLVDERRHLDRLDRCPLLLARETSMQVF